MTQMILASHVAILVPSVRKAADFLRRFDFQIGEEEIWEGEGAKEIYVEKAKANSLLLMEPVMPGAYQRAMDKRGPGLHHLAIDVPNLEIFLESLTGSGWLLHPISIKTIKNLQTAYLARPGFPGLIEVQEKNELLEREIFVDAVTLDFESSLSGLLNSIGLEKIVKATKGEAEISVAGNTIKLSNLYS